MASRISALDLRRVFLLLLISAVLPAEAVPGNEVVEEAGPGEPAAAEPDTVGAMEVVDVVGQADSEKRSLTGLVTISSDAVAAIPALGEADPIRTLAFLPGVQTASDISSGLYIRGGSPDQTLILLDDVPVYNPTHAFGLFSTFNSDVVDQVRLYKGAFPARYGGRIGSVLDVRNRSNDASEVSGRAGMSTITGRMFLEGPAGGGTWLASARRTYLEPILDAIRTEDNEIPSYYFYDFNGRYHHPGSGRGDWLLSTYVGRDDLFLDLDEDSFIDINWGNEMYSGKYRHVFGDDLSGSLLVSTSEYESRTTVEIFTTPVVVNNRLRDVSVRGDVNWEPHAAHRIAAGIETSWYDFEYDESFNFDTQTRFRSQPVDVSAYAEDEWTTSGGSIYGGGVRLRWFSEGDRWLVEPRLSLSWPVGDDKRVKLGGGAYHQYLQLVTTEGFSAGDFYLPVDETVSPPRSIQAVAGFEWRLSRRYEMSLETYYTSLANLLTLDNQRGADGEVNDTEQTFSTGGEGYATGIELFLRRRTGALTGWVGYTLGWTRRKFDTIDNGSSYAPKYDRRHDLNIVGSLDRGKWTYGATFVLGTGQAFTPITARYGLRNPGTGELSGGGRVLPGSKNSARLLPYHRLDASVTRDFRFFGRDAEWFVQVFNLYSRRNEWFVQYDTTGDEEKPKVVKMLPIIPSLGIRFDF